MFWNATRCPGLSSLSFLYLEQGTQVSGKEGTGNFSTVAVDRDLICLLGRGWEDRDGPSPALFSTPTACILCTLFTCCCTLLFLDFPATMSSLVPVPSQINYLHL